MKQVFCSLNPKRTRITKLTIWLCVAVLSLLCQSSLADLETVDGLLANNVNNKATSNEALKTQKKQYPRKWITGDEANHAKNKTSNTKLKKWREFQAQKHQKLNNAIQENSRFQVNRKSNEDKQLRPTFQNVLVARNNQIKNKLASDAAARNINFLNERARPPRNREATGSGNTLNQNGLEQPKNNLIRYPSLHPDTIGRISYRGM